MRQRVADFIAQHGLLQAGSKVVAGVSGGADSVALLHTLWSLAPSLELRLFAAHLTHGIRGGAVSLTVCRFTAAGPMCPRLRAAMGKRSSRLGATRAMAFSRRRDAILARM